MANQSQFKSECSLGSTVEAYSICNNRDAFYYIWKLYFLNEEYSKTSETNKKIQAFQDFLERNQFLISSISIDNILSLDINLLYNDVHFLSGWPSFLNDIHSNAEHTLKCLQLGIHEIIIKRESMNNFEYVLQNRHRIKIKLQNYLPTTPIQIVKENIYETLVSVMGHVIKLTNSKLVPLWLVFGCSNCELHVVVKQKGGLYVQPKICNICGNKQWNQVLDSPFSTNVHTQLIKIQEWAVEKEAYPIAVVPSIYVQLTDDIVNYCLPGNIITVTGIVKIVKSKSSIYTNPKQNDLYIKAISVVNHSKESTNLYELLFNPNLDVIRQIGSQENIFKILVQSLCPMLHGQEMVKAALLLSLFGGTDSHIHTLIITNPGFARTPLLQSCASAASKGIYVRGSKSTNSGITVTISQGKEIESFTIEARALVLGNDGHCCIDELEVLTNQHRALTNAMARSNIKITQSNLICSFPTRTTILACIKPNRGRYDRSKTMLENLNIKQALLSQFDLVYILSDQQDCIDDKSLCDRIISFHAKSQTSTKCESFYTQSPGRDSFASVQFLKQKLASSVGESGNIVPHQVLRMYIGYAKEHVKPKLSVDAVKIFNDFLEDYPQIGNYGFKTLVKLAQARAKIELRSEVNRNDALEVVEIYDFIRSSILDVRQITNVTNPTENGKVTKKKIEMFLTLLKKEASLLQKSIFSLAELNEIAQLGNINITDFKHFVSTLNEQGYLLMLKAGTYKIVI